MLVTCLLLSLTSIAAVTDLWQHKIYNWTTYSGILAGVGLHGLGSALASAGVVDPSLLERWGWLPVGQSMAGLALCGLLMLVCFVLFRIGGGDVKLIAMLGALLGPEKGLEALLWTFVLGAGMGLSILVWRVGAWRLSGRVLRQILYTLRLGRWSPLTDEERALLQPPLYLAPSALAAAAIVQFGWFG